LRFFLAFLATKLPIFEPPEAVVFLLKKLRFEIAILRFLSAAPYAAFRLGFLRFCFAFFSLSSARGDLRRLFPGAFNLF